MWSITTKKENVLFRLVDVSVSKLLTYIQTALAGVHLEQLCMKLGMLLASGMSRVDQTEIIMFKSTLIMCTMVASIIL